MMYEELRCIHCGGRLKLETVSDDLGCNQALDYSAESQDWEYLIALSCCDCGMQYPVLRDLKHNQLQLNFDFSINKKNVRRIKNLLTFLLVKI